MERAIIYTRVSSDRNRQGRSVAEQEAECRAQCERNGWDVAEVVCDNDRSASRHAKKDRPGWRRVRGLLEAGKADVLVTWEASRAQRDLSAYVELRSICREAGVRWSYSGRVHDLDDVNDSFAAGLDALVAEREAEETRRRIQRAMRANASKGRPHGRRLFGYRRLYDPDSGVLVGQEPHPEEAQVVREIAARLLEGEPASRIAESLNDRGVATPAAKGWDVTRIKRIGTNPSYAALRTHRGEIVGEADWPPLIERDDFDRLTAVLTDPARLKFYAGRDVRHLLSGIARCGICGSRLYRGHDRGRGVYVCRDGKQHLVRSQEHLDAYVTAVVIGLLERADLDLANPDDQEAAEARGEAAELRARLDSAVAEFTEGNLSASTLATIEGKLTADIEAAERRARTTTVAPVAATIAGEGVADRWDTLTVAQRRQVVAELVDVVVHKSTAKSGSRRFDPETVDVTPRI